MPDHHFLLLGPRATGKSTWLAKHFGQALWINLLHETTYLSLLTHPTRLHDLVLAHPKDQWVVIDEVQRVPALLNEVHALIAKDHGRFALSGSSARKLKRTHANLLAGRALVKQMSPLVHGELPQQYGIMDRLAWGCLPRIVTSTKERLGILEAYVNTYLKEEIKEEALSRRIDVFVRFLEVAALCNGQITNISNIARDAHTQRNTATNYFEILTDTLIGCWLKAWQPKIRVKEVEHPKFYFFDTGVVRALQGRLRDPIANEERGLLLETYILHELRSARAILDVGGDFYYWRTNNGVELDFIWQRGTKRVGIEVKSSTTWESAFEAGLRTMTERNTIKPTHCYGVYLGKEKLKRDWGLVLPINDFCNQLWAGKILG